MVQHYTNRPFCSICGLCQSNADFDIPLACACVCALKHCVVRAWLGRKESPERELGSERLYAAVVQHYNIWQICSI